MARELLDAAWQVTLSLAPWLFAGAAIAGLLHGLLPQRFVRSHLRGFGGVAKAVGLAVPMPLCSCGVIPAALGLKRDGASDGAAIGFMIATPQTGADALLVSARFLGWPFAVFALASTALTGLLGGWLTEAFGGARASATTAEPAPEPAEDRSPRGMALHAVDILRSIWRWLVLGIAASAAITVFIPPGSLAGLGAWGPLGAGLLALAVSLPLYVCATASVPIAASLVAAGMPAGAALVFLMAGPATNVSTLGAVYRGFGRRVLAIYLGTLVVASLSLAMLFEWVIPSAGAVAAAVHQHRATSWEIGAALAFLTLLGFFAIEDLRRWRARRASRSSPLPVHELAVEGMVCDGCVRKVERALAATDGVTSATVTLDPGRAVVRGRVDEARLRAAITTAGYRAS
ncbi:MAG: permease [Thermoanaerobaculia bacterium]